MERRPGGWARAKQIPAIPWLKVIEPGTASTYDALMRWPSRLITERGRGGRSCNMHASFFRTLVLLLVIGAVVTLLTHAWAGWATDQRVSPLGPWLPTYAALAVIGSALSSRPRIEADELEIRIRRLGRWRRRRWEEVRSVNWTFSGLPRRGAARLALDLADQTRRSIRSRF